MHCIGRQPWQPDAENITAYSLTSLLLISRAKVVAVKIARQSPRYANPWAPNEVCTIQTKACSIVNPPAILHGTLVPSMRSRQAGNVPSTSFLSGALCSARGSKARRACMEFNQKSTFLRLENHNGDALIQKTPSIITATEKVGAETRVRQFKEHKLEHR